jgi:hypothetical protein
MIKYIHSANIDKLKWDQCISSSKSPLVYGYSWYLDLVSPRWCGIIKDDYSAVMPLPVKKKYGIDYIIQPVYTQQLGIFTAGNCNNDEIKAFVNAIPLFYRFIDMNLNYSNKSSGLTYNFGINRNYELNLQNGKEEILKGFSVNTRRNIQKGISAIEIKEEIPLNEIMKLIRKNALSIYGREHYVWINNFIHEIIQKQAGFTIGAYFKNELCASVFCLLYRGRIYYLIPVSNNTGKEKRAMFAIIDHLIGKYAGSDITLDFEGSNLEGIARFFDGFGAKPLNYTRIRINRLPFPYKLFIRNG